MMKGEHCNNQCKYFDVCGDEERETLCDGYEIIFSDFKTVECTTTSGYSWKTSVNRTSTLESVCQYFLGQWFDIGVYPVEKMEKVIGLRFWDVDGSLTKKVG